METIHYDKSLQSENESERTDGKSVFNVRACVRDNHQVAEMLRSKQVQKSWRKNKKI